MGQILDLPRQLIMTLGGPIEYLHLAANVPRLLLGRGFRKEDEAADSTSIIVSERLVRELWNGLDPLNRRIEIGNRVAMSWPRCGVRSPPWMPISRRSTSAACPSRSNV